VDDGYGDNEHTSFIDCVAWGKTGETIARYLHKGRQVVVIGEIRQDRWKADDGSGRSKVYVKVRSFSFVSDGSNNGGGGRREVSNHSDSFDDESIPF
jgi:single-strand DNA-binding protein